MGQKPASRTNAFESDILAVGVCGFAVWSVIECVVQIIMFICGFGVQIKYDVVAYC